MKIGHHVTHVVSYDCGGCHKRLHLSVALARNVHFVERCGHPCRRARIALREKIYMHQLTQKGPRVVHKLPNGMGHGHALLEGAFVSLLVCTENECGA